MHKPGVSLKVHLVDNLDALHDLKSQWIDLHISAQSNFIFTRWEWLNSWARCFIKSDRSLFTLCVTENEQLIAIAPWYVSKTKIGLFVANDIHFIGEPEGGSDYIDIISLQGREKDVALSIYEYLTIVKPAAWDLISLLNIPSESLFMMHFVNLFEQAGKYSHIKPDGYCPFIPLPKSPNDYFLSISSNRRHIYRRDSRRLGLDGDINHITFISDNIREGIDRFSALYKMKSKFADGDELEVFLREVCSHESIIHSIQVDLLTVGGSDVAGLLHLQYSNNLAMLKMAVDKEFSHKVSIGNLIVGMSIEKAILSGFACYDFLKGSEDYKFHWAKQGKLTMSLRVAQKSPATVYLIASDAVKAFFKLLLR